MRSDIHRSEHERRDRGSEGGADPEAQALLQPGQSLHRSSIHHLHFAGGALIVWNPGELSENDSCDRDQRCAGTGAGKNLLS